MHDPSLPTRLHRWLNRPRSSSANIASDLRSYYASRPGLRKYTLGVELDRMDYELVLPDGTIVVDDPDGVRRYFGVGDDGERNNGRGTKMAVEVEEGVGAVETTEELLVRSANQSLLADMLAALTCAEHEFDRDGRDDVRDSTGLVLSGPALCMTSVAETCRFKIDLRSGFVEALCSLAVSIPHHETDDGAASNGRRVLASAKVLGGDDVVNSGAIGDSVPRA